MSCIAFLVWYFLVVFLRETRAEEQEYKIASYCHKKKRWIVQGTEDEFTIPASGNEIHSGFMYFLILFFKALAFRSKNEPKQSEANQNVS